MAADSGRNDRTRRGAVLAHYDPHGRIAPHVRRTIESLAACTDRLVVVSTADLVEADRAWAGSRSELVVRSNTGHDFVSYRIGLDRLDPTSWDEVVLCNDSAVYPADIGALLARMSSARADFWGITPGYGFTQHVQSYFVVFGARSLASPRFARFWREVEVLGGRDEVISAYELGLSAALQDDGLVMGSAFRPGLRDRVVGSARAHASEGDAALRSRRPRRIAGWVRRTVARARRPEWNVAAALADRAVARDPRLPAVKLSNLRDDPYGCDTRALLRACEGRFPEQFAGVRDYLDRTDEAYGGRWGGTHATGPRWSRYRIAAPSHR